MPLPKIVTPSYELTLPSNGKKISYRPFLVKEEKILILAIESNSLKEISRATKDILKNCILTKGVKVDQLPTFDIEYLFLNIRARSIGESIELVVTCPDDGETKVNKTIYIDEIQVKTDDDHNIDIKIDDTYTMRMKYPSLDEFIKNNFDVSGANDISFEESLDIIASCIDVVYNADESWAASDCTKKELSEWLDTLNSNQFKQIETFFETMPKLSHTVKVTNPKTKVESDVALEGITSFFG